ncbi:MAG: ArnT family glycosyltransferase [Candidatus Hydrothermarchaeales archaeon]
MLEKLKKGLDGRWLEQMRFTKFEAIFLLSIYAVGLFLRLAPRLAIDSHLLTFQGDIWYRLAMAQYIFDFKRLPIPDLRYRAYGFVPMWYPPLSPIFFAVLSKISSLDIPTVSSRLLPFIEALTPLPIYSLGRYLYDKKVAVTSTIALALTPSFVFWSGISDPQSFTLFMIPIMILVWIIHSKLEPNNKRLFIFGLFLGFVFLVHLSYFLLILTLLMVTIALIIEENAKKGLLLDLFICIAISQILTAPWWLPNNLYWWWIKALVTSSGLYPVTEQLESYGKMAAIIGGVAIGYILIIELLSILNWVYEKLTGSEIARKIKTAKKEKHFLLLTLWALPLFIETQNEVILFKLNKVAYTWQTLAKPLEGFRFYCFLAQPAALAIGVLTIGLIGFSSRIYNKEGGEKIFSLFWIGLVVTAFAVGMSLYNLDVKFQTSGLTIDEYNAALWFRKNAGPDDRIIADYYRSQMLGGVSAGKALLGGMFPLRNVDYPYIKAPGSVQNDLYTLYNTSSAPLAHQIARQYNVTHIFYSDNMKNYGNLLSYYKSAAIYGVDTDREKFDDKMYFEVVYKKPSSYGEVAIIEVK